MAIRDNVAHTDGSGDSHMYIHVRRLSAVDWKQD